MDKLWTNQNKIRYTKCSSLRWCLLIDLHVCLRSHQAYITTPCRQGSLGLFDEEEGEAAKDSSGNGNDGALIGSPEWVGGRFGTALKVEPNKYVDFPPPTPEVLMLKRDFTCMVWVNPDEWVAGWNCAFSMQAGSTGGEIYGIYFGNSGGTEILLWTRIDGQGSMNITSGQGTLELNKWTHAAATYDGIKLIVYKNGENSAETALSGALDNGDSKGRFVINGNYNSLDGGLSEFCSATIDEVLIFDEAMPASKIKKYMEEGMNNIIAVESESKLATTWGDIKQ